MIRDALAKHYIGLNKEFRFRGEEPGRLENFSDAVFALAITLLLISTSAPTTLEQIKRFVWELLPFCGCIVLIIMIWNEHFIFYYRYGLRNTHVVVLNTIFLIIVLFYVYPLKFLCKVLLLYPLARALQDDAILLEISEMVQPDEMVQLMIIYGAGAASIFFVLMLMYRYALKNAQLLQLNRIEEFDTRTSMTANLLCGLIPFTSTVIALFLKSSPWVAIISGLIYFSYPPVMFIFHIRMSKRRRRLLSELVAD